MACQLLEEVLAEVKELGLRAELIGDRALWAGEREEELEPAIALYERLEEAVKRVVERHVGGRGSIEVYRAQSGVVIDCGEKLAEVVKAALFRVLCYRHSSQLIARVVVKDMGSGFAVSVYADIDYETPWLKVRIKP